MIRVCLQGISKSFHDHPVLVRQSVQFEAGHIYGIVGENGCGKSVLFKCICGLLPLSEGRVDVWEDHKSVAGKPVFGVVIDGAGFIESLSGKRNLMMLADVRGRIGSKQVDFAIRQVGLNPADRKKVRHYSLGMRQRLAIAQALMEEPPVLLLDEPLNGLDFESVKGVYRMLNEQKRLGRVILVASHHEEDIRLLCDTVYWLKNGELKPIEDVSKYKMYDRERMKEGDENAETPLRNDQEQEIWKNFIKDEKKPVFCRLMNRGCFLGRSGKKIRSLRAERMKMEREDPHE